MKFVKLSSLLMAAVMSLSLVGCGQTDTQTPETTPDVDIVEPTPDTKPAPPPAEETDELVTNMPVFEDETMKVTLISIENHSDIRMFFSVENKTDAPIKTGLDTVSINSIIVSMPFLKELNTVDANNTKTFIRDIPASYMAAMNVASIDQLGIIWMNSTTEVIMDTTMLTDIKREPLTLTKLYADDKIKVEITSAVSESPIFMLTNNDSQPLTIVIDSVLSVEYGNTIDPNIHVTLLPHTSAFVLSDIGHPDGDYDIQLHYQMPDEVGEDFVQESRVDSGSIRINL